MTDRENREELSKLLPFYLNATLPPGERARVDAGLAKSESLRGELEEHCRLMAMVKTAGAEWADQALPAAPVIALAATPTPAGPAAGSFLAFLVPSNWSPAVSLALALAVATEGAALLWQNQLVGQLKEENYQLASGKDATTAKGSIIAEVKDDAAWKDVVELLAREGLSISSSSDFGALVLHSDKQGAALEQQIARLRSSPLIASAELAA
jgi:hypothetical protein